MLDERAAYFPMQKFAKMVCRRSSRTVSPVISPRALRDAVRWMVTKSSGVPASKSCSARSRDAADLCAALGKDLATLTGDLNHFRQYVLKSLDVDPDAATEQGRRDRLRAWRAAHLGFAVPQE